MSASGGSSWSTVLTVAMTKAFSYLCLYNLNHALLPFSQILQLPVLTYLRNSLAFSSSLLCSSSAQSPQVILNFPYYKNDKSQNKPIWWQHLVCYGRLFGVHKFSIESRLEFSLVWNNRMWRKWCSANSWTWASRGFSASIYAH